MRRVPVFAGAILSLVLSSAPAWADECTPKLIAALDMIDEPDGRVAVSVGLAGAQHRMLLGTAEAHSELFAPAMAAAGYRKLDLSERKTFDIFGGHAVGYAEVDSMMLANVRGGDVKMLVTPGPYRGDGDVAGVLGADLLGNFDVDLDFKAHKVNLFAPNPCEGKRVYWSEKYSQLALDGPEGRVLSTMTLDGKPVQVAMDSLSTSMRLHFNVAKALFGLDTSSPGVTPVNGDGDEGRQRYRYAFASLSAGDFAIDHPEIVLAGDPDALPCNGSTHPRLGRLPGHYSTVTCWSGGDLTIGIHRMRKMHLYFAYKARKIYLTDAEAH